MHTSSARGRATFTRPVDRLDVRVIRRLRRWTLSWTIIGSTEWSGTYAGKQDVLGELIGPLFSQFADRYTNTADRFIAEGDHVVVQCRGHVTTKSGMPYSNTYCYVCRLGDGKLRELTEYCDTELIATALTPPAATKTAHVEGDPVDAVTGIIELDVSTDEAIRAMRGDPEPD